MRTIKVLLLLVVVQWAAAQDYFPKNDGVKQTFKNQVAIIHATIYTSPTNKVENATLLIKEDKIVEIGTSVNIPKEATILDATGKTIYASFIDPFTEFGINKPQKKGGFNPSPQYNSERNGYYWNDHIRADE